MFGVMMTFLRYIFECDYISYGLIFFKNLGLCINNYGLVHNDSTSGFTLF